ncbi:MAG: hypothetical protein LBT79_01705 [Elusimicrobiota bacterium]|jgi:predicted Zn-dependent protease|nr:hypothetical protein [Elusimicrobiota bacterium]
MKKIQNQEAKIENSEVKLIEERVVKAATQEIFNRIIDLDNLTNIANDASTEILTDLRNSSFMTSDLELSEKQRERLIVSVNTIFERAKENYKTNIEKDKRTKNIVEVIENQCRQILEELLSKIALEVNRGAILNSIACAADTKSNDYNKIELRYSKNAGDITIPTRGIFISTNCIELISKNVKIEADIEEGTDGNEN